MLTTTQFNYQEESNLIRMQIELGGAGFSAAHFVIGHKTCEHLHGHNWSVRVTVDGDEDDRGLVVDFIELKKILKNICDEFDHRTLIPTNNSSVKIIRKEGRTEILVHNRKYELPDEDVALVPAINITVEELARVIAEKLKNALLKYKNVYQITVEAKETEGESAKITLPLRGS